MGEYEFSVDWFSKHTDIWLSVLPEASRRARKIMEIGSYEGKSTVWLLENTMHSDGGELYCIDTWEGGLEHQRSEMGMVEKRFNENTKTALRNRKQSRIVKLKGTSRSWLANLIAGGHASSFDLIYVDGSHQAPDVLEDLVSAFQLCKVGGTIVCDDYLWEFGRNPVLTPKLAIDAFTNCFVGKITILPAPINQVFIIKESI